MLDTVREIETPEGITLRLRAAGALPRAQAWMIDLVLRLAVLFVAMVPLSLFGVAGNGLAMLLMFALMWAYSVVCEVWLGGQTLGKRALGLRVVNADGTPVAWLPSVVRNLLRGVDILPGVYGVGLVSTLVDPYARRLGDIVAGTMVIHVNELPVGQQVPGGVLALPPGAAVRLGDHRRTGAGRDGHEDLRQVPDRPPLFDSTWMSVIDADRSTALIMSRRARPAAATAVSASISTPVRSAVRVVAVISTPSSRISRSTDTACSATG